MSETNIFNCIQIEIMKINPSEILDLLEASIKGIQKISSSTPEFAEVLRKLPNNFAEEDTKVLNFLFENINNPYVNNAIKAEDSGILLLLKGGEGTPPGSPRQQAIVPAVQQQGVVAVQPQGVVAVQPQGVGAVQPQGVGAVQKAAMDMTSSLFSSIGTNIINSAQGGLTSEQTYELAKRQTDAAVKFVEFLDNTTLADRMRAQANLVETLSMQSNQLFGQRLTGAGFLLSFAAPGVLMYKLEGLLSGIAMSAVNVVGTVASTAVGAGELAVRNAAPFMFQSVRASLSGARAYIPDAAFSILQTVSQGVRSIGIDEFAQTSVSGVFVERVSAATAANTDSAILIGCILVYIALVLVLILFVAFIVKILTGDFGAYLSLGPFGFIGIRPPQKRGGRFTRNNRQMKKYRKHKKTHKRSK